MNSFNTKKITSLLALLVLFIFAYNSESHAEESHAGEKGVELGHHYEDHSKTKAPEEKKKKKSSSILSKVVLYVPNRIFDFLDIFRLRVRVGPGIGLGVRATEPLSFYAGSHATIYAGLPGPRQSPSIPLPIGAETVAGGRLSLIDGVIAADTSARHSFSEIGVETQLLLVGVDVGVDPVEILDFFTGFFFIQIRDDDL